MTVGFTLSVGLGEAAAESCVVYTMFHAGLRRYLNLRSALLGVKSLYQERSPSALVVLVLTRITYILSAVAYAFVVSSAYIVF